MNPYRQIAKEHLTKEDLEELLAEMQTGPAEMSYEDRRVDYYCNAFKKLKTT